jgi:hypothetical protein
MASANFADLKLKYDVQPEPFAEFANSVICAAATRTELYVVTNSCVHHRVQYPVPSVLNFRFAFHSSYHTCQYFLITAILPPTTPLR